jgi:hypothetical protein
MVPLICKLSDRIDGQLLSLIFDPTIVKKELPPQFLSLTSRNCGKTSNQIMYFYHIEAAMSYCILYRLWPVFGRYHYMYHNRDQDFSANETQVLGEEASR